MLAWRRIEAALRTFPDRRGWIAVLCELAWGVPLIVAMAFAGGLARFDPAPFDAQWLRVFFLVMIVPAFAEELLFRALIVPRPGRPFALWQGALCVGAFVAWHPFQAFTFGPPWSAVFLDPWFLTAVALLGTMLVRLYRATGSLWPCIATHWLVVMSWKLLFGGPFG